MRPEGQRREKWEERCEKKGWNKGGRKAGRDGVPEMQRLKESLGHEDEEEKQKWRQQTQGSAGRSDPKERTGASAHKASAGVGGYGS